MFTCRRTLPAAGDASYSCPCFTSATTRSPSCADTLPVESHFHPLPCHSRRPQVHRPPTVSLHVSHFRRSPTPQTGALVRLFPSSRHPSCPDRRAFLGHSSGAIETPLLLAMPHPQPNLPSSALPLPA